MRTWTESGHSLGPNVGNDVGQVLAGMITAKREACVKSGCSMRTVGANEPEHPWAHASVGQSICVPSICWPANFSSLHY